MYRDPKGALLIHSPHCICSQWDAFKKVKSSKKLETAVRFTNHLHEEDIVRRVNSARYHNGLEYLYYDCHAVTCAAPVRCFRDLSPEPYHVQSCAWLVPLHTLPWVQTELRAGQADALFPFYMNHNVWQVGHAELSGRGINSTWNSAVLSSEKEGRTRMVGNPLILQHLEKAINIGDLQCVLYILSRMKDVKWQTVK